MRFPKDEYEQRWSRLDAKLAELGYDTAVIWQRTGGSYDRAGKVWYFTGYASHASGQEPSSGASLIGSSLAALLFRRGHEPELHITEAESTVDPRYVAVERIHGHVKNLPAGLAARLNELGIEGRVAYVGDDFLPLEIDRILRADAPAVEWCAEDAMLDVLLGVKSERELDLYREAGAIATDALTVFMEKLIAGERQCDAAAAAASTIIKAGGGFQRVSCHTGPASEHYMWDYPLYGYSKEAAKPGEMVRAWVYGPILEGYWLDPGRSSVCGTPSPQQRKLIEDTVAITEAIMDVVRPGATPRQAGVVGDRLAAERGYGADMGGALWDLYGHGLSTFWNGPIIPSHGAAEFQDDHAYWDVDRPFHAGQVYTVETFFREPGIGTATFEEVFIIHDDGLERLTTTPMLFW
ncbi:MAG TPA: M24 family metallopeptidase [Solirubrobacter sp.]|nr:M24 family metallopeptidase [Solirubrobacter sp.]